MKNTYYGFFLLLLLSVPFCFGSDDSTEYQSDDVSQALFNLKGWDNQLIKEQLTLRIKDNQQIISFINEHSLGETDKATDDSFNSYVNSLMEDQQNLTYITGQLITISDKEVINLDGTLAKKPLFRQRLQKELDENLGRKSSEILLFRMLYFSLMEKYAVR